MHMIFIRGIILHEKTLKITFKMIFSCGYMHMNFIKGIILLEKSLK